MLAIVENLSDPSLLVVGILAIVIGIAFGVMLSRWRVRWRMARSRRMGTRGEARAWKLLKRAGYKVTQTQVSGEIDIEVDGVLEAHTVRADALAEKNDDLFLVEVKGGDVSADPRNRNTRRQLLEYALAFDTDGLLLVDAANKRIRTIRFPQLEDV